MRVLMVLIAAALLVFGADSKCLKIAQRLRVLQNDIVAKSFKGLKPGAWALYNKGKVVYLGKLRSPYTHKIHHVAQIFSPRATEEVWYDIVKQDITVAGKRFPFWYLRLREAFVSTSNGTFYISPRTLELFLKMRGSRLTTMFTGPVVPEPRCEHLVELHDVAVTLPKGKRVEAVKIVDAKHPNRVVLVSSRVPFGMVNDLVDFGWSGAKPRLTKRDRLNAKRFAPLPLPTLPVPILPGGGVR
jgi:hypothetical protein